LAKQTLSPVIVTDPNRKITWVNDAFIRTYKYSSEEALGRDPQEVLSGPETSGEKLERFQKMILCNEAFTDRKAVFRSGANR
jgi:PAS domain S-box-containing protein